MKKLHEIVKEKTSLQQELNKLTEKFEEKKKELMKGILKMDRLERISLTGADISKVQIAETILYVEGNIYGNTDNMHKFYEKHIAVEAINDIANGCEKLKKEYFGNKEYSGFYQRCDCSYGMGPTHGGIVDRIGLINPKRKLTDDEKDACIYYLGNYNKYINY